MKKRTLLNYCGLLGIVSLLSYTAAVVFSPLAYPGYNWMAQAVSRVKEFYLLPVGKELLRYDTLAVNTIVKNRLGEVSSCDVPYSDDLARFNSDYLRLTKQVTESCENHDLTESMVIGTSAIIDTEPLHHLGQVSPRIYEDDALHVVPVPPHADGRGARRALPRAGAGEYTDSEDIKLSLLAFESAGIVL